MMPPHQKKLVLFSQNTSKMPTNGDIKKCEMAINANGRPKKFDSNRIEGLAAQGGADLLKCLR
jgi:hypothetical protein